MRHKECAIVLTLIIKEWKGGRGRKNEEVTAVVAVTGTFSLELCFPRVIIKQISSGKCGAQS